MPRFPLNRCLYFTIGSISVHPFVSTGPCVEVPKLINVNQMATKTVEGFVSFGSFASGQRVNVLFVIGIDRPARTAGEQVALKAGVG